MRVSLPRIHANGSPGPVELPNSRRSTIGRPIRLATLRALIAFVRDFPDVWFATSDQIVGAFIAHESGGDKSGAVT